MLLLPMIGVSSEPAECRQISITGNEALILEQKVNAIHVQEQATGFMQYKGTVPLKD
jgi:hypothetical protein